VNQRRLTSRDYKSAQGGAIDWRRWREFGAGLGLGLLAALAVYVGDHRGNNSDAEIAPPARRSAEDQSGAAATATATATATDDSDFSFYERLPKFEVVVPEKERSARVNAGTRIDKPGTYYLQIGSYRDADEAQRVQEQLARQDISAGVQRVAVDNDVWHRVRVGPIRDLGELNKLRARLQTADKPVLIINVTE
jgi:cell division protein FtsN